MTLIGMLSYRGVDGNKIYFPTPEKRREGKERGERKESRGDKTLQNCGPLGFLWHFLCMQPHTVTHRRTVIVKTSSLHIKVIMGALKVNGI